MPISIIIPLYNQGHFLSECLESVFNQTVAPYEIIVINDGSKDNSLEIARRYESKGVKVIDQVNKGLSSARNTGIMNATGDYILPLDADDMLLENCIEELIKQIDDEVDIISPSFRTFEEAQQDIVLMSNPTLEDFKTGNRVGYCSLIKKSVLLEVGGYSPKMIYGYEDFALWFNLLSRGKVLRTIPDILWLYRIKKHSMIHTAQAHHMELMAQIRKDFPHLYD